MITREEQKALFDSLVGDLTINTLPDGSGLNVVIPVEVNWGLEPKIMTLPAITIKFISYGIPLEKTLGDVWRDETTGFFIGYIAGYTLLVKIRTQDYINGSNFIEKTDIAEALYKRVWEKAMFTWDSLITDGGIHEDGPDQATDVSEILELESYKELQLTIKLKKLTGGVPDESAMTVKITTAPTIIYVEGVVELT